MQLDHPVALEVSAEETIARRIVHDVLRDHTWLSQYEGGIAAARNNRMRALRD
jgi:hypothetical protein